MPRKSQLEKLVDDLMQAPWWVSPIVGIVFFVGLRFIFPNIFLQSPIGSGIAGLSFGIAPIAFVFFCFVGFLSFFNQRRKARLVDDFKGERSYSGLSWKEFEELVAEAYRRKGYKVQENFERGPDGGVDVWLRKEDQKILIQCKRWNNRKVGVKVVRELLGLVAAEEADKGILAISGQFTQEAIRFAHGRPIELIDGRKLTKFIKHLKETRQSTTPVYKYNPNFDDEDRKIPRCPRCGSDMVLRIAKQGKYAGRKFYGCTQFPQCRGIRQVGEKQNWA